MFCVIDTIIPKAYCSCSQSVWQEPPQTRHSRIQRLSVPPFL